MKVTVIPIAIGTVETVSNGLKKRLKELQSEGRIETTILIIALCDGTAILIKHGSDFSSNPLTVLLAS